MDAKIYNNEAYFAECFQTFAELRHSEQTCDISLLTSNKKIKAHKVVLASASEYFKNAIYGLFLGDSSKYVLELNQVHYEILLVIVDYMYTGRIEINSENVYDIYKAADYYMMNFVKTMCLEFLKENLTAENCVKQWIMANNSNYEKLRIAAENIFYSNLEIVSSTPEFLNLSKYELLDLLGVFPKDKLLDSVISAALKWAADKEQWEVTLFTILKDITVTRISDDYLENFLSDNKLIQKSVSCNKWLLNIYKEKSKLYKLQQAAELKLNNLKLAESAAESKLKNVKLAESEDALKLKSLKLAEFEAELKVNRLKLAQSENEFKLHISKIAESKAELKLISSKLAESEADLNVKNAKLAEFEAELKFARFIVDQPLILAKHEHDGSHNFFKYNLRDGALSIFSTTEHTDYAFDIKTYKKWIYVVASNHCRRCPFDNPNTGYELFTHHNHGRYAKAAVLNESMHIFGGNDSLKKGSSINLNTKQCTSFSLLHEREYSGVAINDGSIYICGGEKTNIIEHFDPREGRTSEFGRIPFYKTCLTYAAALPNQIYCCHFDDYKMMDIRNYSKWIDIKSPGKEKSARCLFSSQGRLFTVFNHTIFEYNHASENWNTLRNLPQSDYIWLATSFE